MVDAQLIELIHERPPLYDYLHDDHNKHSVIEELWQEISNQLNLSVTECKRKWKNLRRYYNKLLDRGRDPSDHSTAWEHFESMHFVFNHLRSNRTTLKSGKPAVAVRKWQSHQKDLDDNSMASYSSSHNGGDHKNETTNDVILINDDNVGAIRAKPPVKRVANFARNNCFSKKSKTESTADEQNDATVSKWLNNNPVVVIGSNAAAAMNSSTTESVDPLALSIHNFIKDLPPMLKLKLTTDIFQLIYTTWDQYQASQKQDAATAAETNKDSCNAD